MTERTDAERIDWMEKHLEGCALLSDDRGNWTISSTGAQNIPAGDAPADIWTSFEVPKEHWHLTLRQAIDHAMDGGPYADADGEDHA